MAFGGQVWKAGKILVLVGALALTYVVTAGIAMRVALRAREVRVPALVGRTLQDATTALTAEGLSLRLEVSERRDANVPPGRILAQEPAAGSPSRRQRAVKVWVNAGIRASVAPRVVGDSVRGAEARLVREGFAPPVLTELRSAALPADVVVAQDPPPATPATTMHLLVNRGRDNLSYVMPPLLGLQGEPAAAVLRSSGFRVSVVDRPPAEGLPPGTVVRQAPDAGHQVRPGDAIALEVSR